MCVFSTSPRATFRAVRLGKTANHRARRSSRAIPLKRITLIAPLFDLLTACWFGVIGACVGSFLNVVAYRMPLGMSVIWKPSHCPKCKTQISARDNVPVLGWLWLKGRCRACSEPISPRYAIVEAVMGLTFFILCYAEVFSGGANLPTGPLTEGRGALDNVIEPNWTVLGVYGFHCVLMCLLMCFLLVEQDHPHGNLSIRLIFVFMGLLLCVEALPALRDTHEAGYTWLALVANTCIGGAIVLDKYDFIEVNRMYRRFLLLCVVVTFLLGGNSAPTLVLIAFLLGSLLSFQPYFFTKMQNKVWLASLYLSTVVQLVFWKELYELITA